MSKASEKLAALVKQFAEDDDKFESKKNNSAGTRARKALQDIKKVCQERRDEIQKQRADEEAA